MKLNNSQVWLSLFKPQAYLKGIFSFNYYSLVLPTLVTLGIALGTAFFTIYLLQPDLLTQFDYLSERHYLIIVLSIALIALIAFGVLMTTGIRSLHTSSQSDELAIDLINMDILQTTLDERVDERTAELEARNSALERYLYSVSHDLKSPLRIIRGYSQVLLEDHLDNLDLEAQDHLHSIHTSADKMSQMIDDLLSYSRLQQREVQNTHFRISEIFSTLIDERRSEIKERKIEIRIRLNYDSVYADKEALTQALRNLIDNALKFTEKNLEPVIEIRGYLKGSSCIISVKDNGIGFDMKHSKRIFEIFQRLNKAEDYPGTGIGLALVDMAMKRSGGRVWVDSTPMNGATFFLEIPIN